MIWTGQVTTLRAAFSMVLVLQRISQLKSLKAFVLSKTGTLRKMHDLRALLEDCITTDQSFESLREKVLTVLPYYIETRYPMYEELVVFTKEMAEEAYEYAQDIYTFVNDKINI